MALGLGMLQLGHGPSKVWKNDNLMLIMTFFTGRSNYFYIAPGQQHSLAEIDHEIFSTVILSHLIQEGQNVHNTG